MTAVDDASGLRWDTQRGAWTRRDVMGCVKMRAKGGKGATSPKNRREGQVHRMGEVDMMGLRICLQMKALLDMASGCGGERKGMMGAKPHSLPEPGGHLFAELGLVMARTGGPADGQKYHLNQSEPQTPTLFGFFLYVAKVRNLVSYNFRNFEGHFAGLDNPPAVIEEFVG
ncbi:hypothetical protein DFH06DRAFT_1297875 [Mycena polygramma]|nr:hypothetical protein DFH06DRAFT_1297875 [Mycena polygramma]